jgi:hypothetical protein
MVPNTEDEVFNSLLTHNTDLSMCHSFDVYLLPTRDRIKVMDQKILSEITCSFLEVQLLKILRTDLFFDLMPHVT